MDEGATDEVAATERSEIKLGQLHRSKTSFKRSRRKGEGSEEMKQTLSVRTNRPMTGAKKLTEDDFLKLAVKQIEKKDCHGKLKIIPLAGDASLRRYFRVQLGGVSRVLMLAKPFNQDS